MRASFRQPGREELDFQLSPSKSAKDFRAILSRHEAETAALECMPGLRVRRGIAYGTSPRQHVDVTRPADVSGALPCLAFIHGGFWQEGSTAGSGFAAASLAARGWAHAAIGYRLAPEASLSAIVADAAAAVAMLHDRAAEFGIDPERIVLAGHSAGAHLAACMLCGISAVPTPARMAGVPAGAILISGVFDLGPIAASYVNDLVGMNRTDIETLSPLFRMPMRDVPVHIVVGGDEPEAFRWQSEALAGAWASRLSRLTLEVVGGRDHFDVLDELAICDTATRRSLEAMAPMATIRPGAEARRLEA